MILLGIAVVLGEGILASFFPYTLGMLSYFTPFLLLIYLILLRYFWAEDRRYLFTIFGLGLFYGICYTRYFLFTAVLFLMLGVLLTFFQRRFRISVWTAPLYFAILLFFYELTTLAVFSFFHLTTFSFFRVVDRWMHLLLFNLILLELGYFVFYRIKRKHPGPLN